MPEQDDYIIALLLEEGRLSAGAVEPLRKVAIEQRQSLCDVLIEQTLLTPREVALARAQISEVPYADLEHYTIDLENTHKVPKAMAESLQVMPLFITDDVATVGMANPLDLHAVDQLRALLRCEVEPVLCEARELKGLIDRAYTMAGQDTEAPAKAAGEAFIDLTTGKEPIVAAVNQIIAQAIDKSASDIHIGADESTLHLRLRIDGQLMAQQGPQLSAHAGIVQRLKVMANLDLTQSRRPHDGKFRFSHNGRAVDIRLSIIPTVSGENIVMRLLSSATNIRGYSELGLPPQTASALERILDEPHGMMLVTGPTGSGKTTTLYTCLKKLNQPGLNVMTIEDPVEIRMPLIRQVQVNTEIGMTFAGALRSMLRQDPDVVMVGEIRDEETARIAIQSALTGHLVLSSLHTNDAAGAIPRLRDYGCPPFAINAALLGVMAQRLLRRACRDCAQPEHPPESLLKHFGQAANDGTYVKGPGCPRCAGTGYQGRLGCYELLRMTAPVQNAIEENATIQQLRIIAKNNGLRPMWIDGVEKAKVGLTTLAEVARVVAVLATESETPGPSEPLETAALPPTRKSA